MTKSLERAIALASTLPDEQQDALAALLLSEISDESRWNAAFDRSKEALSALAAEAREEYRLGLTRALSPGDFEAGE